MDTDLKIYKDVETDELVLTDHDYKISKFDSKQNKWIKLDGWLAKPGELNTIDINLALRKCNCILPDEYACVYSERSNLVIHEFMKQQNILIIEEENIIC